MQHDVIGLGLGFHQIDGVPVSLQPMSSEADFFYANLDLTTLGNDPRERAYEVYYNEATGQFASELVSDNTYIATNMVLEPGISLSRFILVTATTDGGMNLTLYNKPETVINKRSPRAIRPF